MASLVFLAAAARAELVSSDFAHGSPISEQRGQQNRKREPGHYIRSDLASLRRCQTVVGVSFRCQSPTAHAVSPVEHHSAPSSAPPGTLDLPARRTYLPSGFKFQCWASEMATKPRQMPPKFSKGDEISMTGTVSMSMTRSMAGDG